MVSLVISLHVKMDSKRNNQCRMLSCKNSGIFTFKPEWGTIFSAVWEVTTALIELQGAAEGRELGVTVLAATGACNICCWKYGGQYILGYEKECWGIAPGWWEAEKSGGGGCNWEREGTPVDIWDDTRGVGWSEAESVEDWACDAFASDIERWDWEVDDWKFGEKEVEVLGNWSILALLVSFICELRLVSVPGRAGVSISFCDISVK